MTDFINRLLLSYLIVSFPYAILLIRRYGVDANTEKEFYTRAFLLTLIAPIYAHVFILFDCLSVIRCIPKCLYGDFTPPTKDNR